MFIYKVWKEDWTNVGGPMHMQDNTPTIWEDYFHKFQDAASIARDDYNKKITWRKTQKDTWISGDLGSCAYYIKKIEAK